MLSQSAMHIGKGRDSYVPHPSLHTEGDVDLKSGQLPHHSKLLGKGTGRGPEPNITKTSAV